MTRTSPVYTLSLTALLSASCAAHGAERAVAETFSLDLPAGGAAAWIVAKPPSPGSPPDTTDLRLWESTTRAGERLRLTVQRRGDVINQVALVKQYPAPEAGLDSVMTIVATPAGEQREGESSDDFEISTLYFFEIETVYDSMAPSSDEWPRDPLEYRFPHRQDTLAPPGPRLGWHAGNCYTAMPGRQRQGARTRMARLVASTEWTPLAPGPYLPGPAHMKAKEIESTQVTGALERIVALGESIVRLPASERRSLYATIGLRLEEVDDGVQLYRIMHHRAPDLPWIGFTATWQYDVLSEVNTQFFWKCGGRWHQAQGFGLQPLIAAHLDTPDIRVNLHVTLYLGGSWSRSVAYLPAFYRWRSDVWENVTTPDYLASVMQSARYKQHARSGLVQCESFYPDWLLVTGLSHPPSRWIEAFLVHRGGRSN